MRLALLAMNGLALGAVGWIVAFGAAEQQAKTLLPETVIDGVPSADFQVLEAQAALTQSPRSVVALAAAYLDRGQSGLATAVIERAPPALRESPEVAQLYARALFYRGHTREALAVATSANEACVASASCAPWLLGKTARQVAFFSQVVAAGIDDPQRDPAATRVAYERSSHEVRLVAMR